MHLGPELAVPHHSGLGWRWGPSPCGEAPALPAAGVPARAVSLPSPVFVFGAGLWGVRRERSRWGCKEPCVWQEGLGVGRSSRCLAQSVQLESRTRHEVMWEPGGVRGGLSAQSRPRAAGVQRRLGGDQRVWLQRGRESGKPRGERCEQKQGGETKWTGRCCGGGLGGDLG